MVSAALAAGTKHDAAVKTKTVFLRVFKIFTKYAPHFCYWYSGKNIGSLPPDAPVFTSLKLLSGSASADGQFPCFYATFATQFNLSTVINQRKTRFVRMDTLTGGLNKSTSRRGKRPEIAHTAPLQYQYQL
jgi:hypothetical protein